MNTNGIRKYAMRFGALALLSAAFAATPMMTPEQQTDMLDKAVTLTPDQKTKVMAMYTADAKKMADLRAAQDPDMRTKMMAMRTDEQTQIKALLTDDQKPKYDTFLASQPQGRGGRGGGGGGMPPPPPPQL
jgi:type IV secretory pathway VirJ component